MRIQKFIAECGVCSRRSAEELVIQGKITVNGKPAEIGMDIDPENDKVVCDGKRVHLKSCDKQYFIFYKPRGVITSMKRENEDDRTVVGDMIKNINGRVYPVGRLDRDSEGILLLTDDGEISLRLTHPRYHISKTYRVTVKGDVSEKQLAALRDGVELEDGMTLPAKVEIKSQSFEKKKTDEEYYETKDGFVLADQGKVVKTALHITINEGRNRQIRRMCGAVGLEVMLLKRIAIGDLLLGHLQPGQYRPLTESEKYRLFESVGLKYVSTKTPKKSAPAIKRGRSKDYAKTKSLNERRFIKEFVKKK